MTVNVKREVVGVSDKLIKTVTSESAPRLEDPLPRSDVPRSCIKVNQPPGGRSQGMLFILFSFSWLINHLFTSIFLVIINKVN